MPGQHGLGRFLLHRGTGWAIWLNFVCGIGVICFSRQNTHVKVVIKKYMQIDSLSWDAFRADWVRFGSVTIYNRHPISKFPPICFSSERIPAAKITYNRLNYKI